MLIALLVATGNFESSALGDLCSKISPDFFKRGHDPAKVNTEMNIEHTGSDQYQPKERLKPHA